MKKRLGTQTVALINEDYEICKERCVRRKATTEENGGQKKTEKDMTIGEVEGGVDDRVQTH